MPDELKSFLFSVSIILAIALFIPLIESIAKVVRRNAKRRMSAEVTEMKPSRRVRGEAA